MGDYKRADFKSKAFRNGGLVRLMDFAVRGLPRSFLPEEEKIDIQWASALYRPEIEQLDALNLQSQWFWSGILGAALISLVIWPQTIELWRRLAEKSVYRNGDGASPACLLYELVLRHQNDNRLTRRQDFQLHVFQVAMAVAQAWVYNDPSQKYRSAPPVPDSIELIERVRKARGEPYAPRGFRRPGDVRPHWIVTDPPEFQHSTDLEEAIALSVEAGAREPCPLKRSKIRSAASWIAKQQPPAHVCHPAALAAAMVTIGQSPGCGCLWRQVFEGNGLRMPNPGQRPFADAAMTIQDCISLANRSSEPDKEALRLYFRSKRCVLEWGIDPDRLWASLPRVSHSLIEESSFWRQSRISFSPVLKFGYDRPRLTLSAAQRVDEADAGS